ncbi:hypothetical protein ACOQFV_24710 [Nocardiopsis changdeensis]|uniref:Uncharacterized protein n=1 Tax=Nocardiopsis changdeensis TaxID=2831969 RepID=A0A975KTT5_9ACTN|nr:MULTISPECIES: hypothetical protein [Nocardiopsis]QUX26407.1 hypothetical protein KGD84_32430 [Nocardiopsis changdeensis]QYX40679.1 hypothetical protein K1J57_32280 [Nocardiopsis sp. MT53]
MGGYDYAADTRPEHFVRVTWEDPYDTIHDAVKADSPEQALAAARANWPGADVILAGPQGER